MRKTRIVFDPSLKIGNNPSLNDCLHAGPCFKKIIARYYVDDVATSFCTMEEGLEFHFKSKKCLKKGGFQLQKWNSNNTKLMDKICVEETRVYRQE